MEVVSWKKAYKGAVHKVRHAIFDQFWLLSPVTLCHTSRNSP